MTLHQIPLTALINDHGDPRQVNQILDALRKAAQDFPGCDLLMADANPSSAASVSLVKAKELGKLTTLPGPSATQHIVAPRVYLPQRLDDLSAFSYLNRREIPTTVSRLMTKVLVELAGLDPHCHVAEVELLAMADDGHILSVHLSTVARQLDLEEQEAALEGLLDELADIRAAYKSTLLSD